MWITSAAWSQERLGSGMVCTFEGIELGGLQLLEPLGTGGLGTTWSATTPAGTLVAAQLLPDVGQERAQVRERRLHALTAVRHPGLAPIIEFPGADRRLYISELIDGPTMAAVVMARGRLTAPEVLSIARDLATSLAYMHERGLIHGDLAPANVVLHTTEQQARPVLVDLLAELGSEGGTRGFAAPEVLAGAPPSTASDVWSLAALCTWATQLSDRDLVLPALAGAGSDSADLRPSAADLADALAHHEVVGVRIPPPSVMAGALLREQAHRERTLLRPNRRARHRKRRRPRTLTVAMIGAMTLVSLVLLGMGADEGPSLARHAAASPPEVSSAPPVDPLLEQLQRLVADRDTALAEGDPAALAALSVPGSPAAQADQQLVAALSAGVEIEGLLTQISEPMVLSGDDQQAQLQVLLIQSSYRQIHQGVVTTVPALPARCVQMTLLAVQGTWRVERTSGCGAVS